MKNSIRRALIVATLFLSVVLSPAWGDPIHFAKDRPVDMHHIRLTLNVDLIKKHVDAAASLDMTALRDVTSITLNAVDFNVTQISLTNSEGYVRQVEYINNGEHINILLGDNILRKGDSATISIQYSITDPKTGLHFFAPTDAEPKIPLQVWSQGESITNRYWVPCFDHPNEMQTTEMIVTAADTNEVISNGKLLSKKNNGDGTATFHWLQDKPHVSYLMTLIVGEFFKQEETWRGKPVRYYVPTDRKDDIKRSFGNTTRMLDFFSEKFGVEYPWDQYAQICAEQFGGGMENTSATTLGSRTLHDERAHLDFSSDGLVSHELGHQWFGDLLTCKDWEHLWLNEGFATYSTAIWYEYDLGRDAYDYDIFKDMRRGYKGGKDKPIVDRNYKHPRQMFDSRAYPKGASVIHMLRHRLGDDVFWRSIKQYLTEYAHKSVETSDFRQVLETVSGRSMERFFHDWTQTPGAPAVSVNYKWNEEQKLAELTVKQTQEADAFHFPLELTFHFEEASTLTLRREITEKKHRFLIPLKQHPTMVLVDPNQAVLMELKQKKGRDLWEAQLSKAEHVVCRIRAAQHFGESGSDRDIELLHEAIQKEPFWGVGVEMAEALGEAGGDDARDALIAGLQLSHPKVRRECADQLGSYHKDEAVISALYTLIHRSDPSYRVEAAAIRSYGDLQPDGASSFLATLLDRDSHRDQIRSSAIHSIGAQPEASGLDVLIEWTRRGKPRFCRTAAISALSELHENNRLSDSQIKKIINAVTASMKGEHRWIQNAAISTLRDMGDDSRPALSVLRALAANDPEMRIRDAAEKAIEKITDSAPKQLQVSELRETVEELRSELDDMKERMEKAETLQESMMLEKGN